MVIIKIKNKNIKADLADNILKQARGLMFSEKKNLMFDMKVEGNYSFWMFGVRFPIKMVFIDSELRVIDIQYAEPLTLNPKSWKVYRNRCRYMLELVDDVNLEVGDCIILYI